VRKEEEEVEESGSLASENRPKEGWIYSMKMYIVSLQRCCEHRSSISFSWSLMTIYEFIEIFILRFLFIITNYRNFMFYPRRATKKLFWNCISTFIFFNRFLFSALFYIIYPSIRNRVFPSDKQDIYRNSWLFLDMID